MIAERNGFTLHLPSSVSAAEVSCRTALRIVSHKRSSYLARWNGRDVFVKLFFDKRRARVHWQREKSGIEALAARSLLTPTLLYAGWLPAQRAYVLITEALIGAQTLADLWAQARDADVKLALLRMAGATLAQQHEAGVVQRDLHPGNFLVVDRQVYSIDASTIRTHKRPLSHDPSLANLGLLLAQFEPAFDRHADKVLAVYALSRCWQISSDDVRLLKAHVDKARAGRQRQFMKKIFRECTAFARRADRKMVLVYDKHYGSDGFQELYRNPDSVFTQAQGRYLKRGNTSTVVRTTVDGVEVVIKRYNIKGVWHGMKRALRRTRASISWENAHLMRFYGIDTPRPIAFIEKRTGPARRTSYFISEYVSGPSYRQYFAAGTASQESQNRLADKLAEMLATLARYRLGHGDMKATNLIIVDGKPHLIDLDGMRQYKSATGFARAHQRDIRRFLKNWADQPDVQARFAQKILRNAPS